VYFCTRNDADVLTYFTGKLIKIKAKVLEKRFARNKRSNYLCRPEREQVHREIEWVETMRNHVLKRRKRKRKFSKKTFQNTCEIRKEVALLHPL
jgi:hypothetical protein